MMHHDDDDDDSHPIQNQNFSNVEFLLKQPRCDRHRIEEAKAHGLIGLRVMTWWSHYGETVLNIAHRCFERKIDDTSHCHSGGRRGVEFVPRCIGINSNPAAGKSNEILYRQHIQFLSTYRIRPCAHHEITDRYRRFSM